jgi:hypothetical protein
MTDRGNCAVEVLMMRVLGILRCIVSGYFCKLNFTETTDERILSDVELLVSWDFCALHF